MQEFTLYLRRQSLDFAHNNTRSPEISRVFTTSCSLGPISIMPLMKWTSLIFCEGKLSRLLKTKLWWCFTGLSSCKLTASSGPFWQRSRKRAFDIPGTRGYTNLLWQWNYIWHISSNWNYHLVKFMLIHCHTPRSMCLLCRLNRKIEWGCGQNHDPWVFQVLNCGTNPYNPYRNALLLLVY